MKELAVYVFSSIPGALLALAAANGLVSERTALILFSASFIGLNLLHMAATWSRVYLERGYWQEAPIERLALPLLLLSGTALTEAAGFGASLLILQYLLSFHHALMQNYGLVRMARRRSGLLASVSSARLDLAAILLLPLGALLWRAGRVAKTYSGALLPVPPRELCATLAGVGALVLLIWIGREIRASWRAGRVEPLPLGLVVGTGLLWSWLLVGFEHPALPLYAFAAGHYFQYLHIVRRFDHRPAALSALPVQWRAWMHPQSALRYFTALTVLGGSVLVVLTVAQFGLESMATTFGWRPTGALQLPPWTAAMIGVNLQHYWLDHRIWRLRKKEVAAPLGVASVG